MENLMNQSTNHTSPEKFILWLLTLCLLIIPGSIATAKPQQTSPAPETLPNPPTRFNPQQLVAVPSENLTITPLDRSTMTTASATTPLAVAATGQYTVTTNLNDPLCDTGFGGYLNLEDNSIPTDPTLFGDTFLVTIDPPLANPINFYNIDYPTISFTDDGFAIFDALVNNGGLPFAPQNIPDANLPNNLIAPLWGDWVITYDATLNQGISVAQLNGSNGVYVIEYDDVQPFNGSPTTLDFEMIIAHDIDHSAGAYEIVFAYNNINGTFPRPLTVGVENVGGSKAMALVNSGDANGVITDTTTVCFDYVNPPAAPTLSAISNSDLNGSYTTSWSSVSGAVGYELQENFNGGSWATIYSGVDRTFNLTGKADGEWCYQVRTQGSVVESDWSDTQCATVLTPPDKPTLDSISNSDQDGNYVVTWPNAPRATSYRLQEKHDGGSWQTVQTGVATSYIATNRTGGEWCYQLRAENDAGDSSWSNSQCTTVLGPPSTPTLNTISNSDQDGSYSVTWNSVATASGYELQESYAGGSWTTVYSGSGSSYAASGRAAGEWCYQVRAGNAAGTSGWSSSQCTTVVVKPAKPVLDPIDNADLDGDYTVSWTAVPGADEYRLQERFNDGSWETLFHSPVLAYNATDQAEGEWCYRLRAENEAGDSDWSSVVCTTVLHPPQAPTLAAIDNSSQNDSFTVDWNNVSGATSYELQERHDYEDWSRTLSTSRSSYDITNRDDGIWCYRVRAINAAGRSLWSNIKCTVVGSPPAKPSLSNISNDDGDGNYAVNWSSTTGATNYRLQAQHDGGDWETVYSGRNTTASFFHQAVGEWCYRVRAENAAGSSDWSGSKCTTVIISAPMMYPIDNANGNSFYSVNWATVQTAVSYTLQEQYSGGSWDTIYSGANSSFGRVERQSGEWCYRVQASNSQGNSEWSTPTCTTVRPDTPVLNGISNPAGDWSFNLNWTAVSGATSYELQELDADSIWHTRYTGAALTYEATVAAGGQWCYHLRAVNAGGASDWSSIKCTVTVPAAPSLHAIDNPSGSGSYEVSWVPSVGATSYVLEETAPTGDTNLIENGLNLTFNATNRSGGEWCYRVQAANSAGSGSWSDPACTTVAPSAPLVNPIDNSDGDGDYSVRWQVAAGATGYVLEEMDENGRFATIYTGSDTSFPVTNRAPGQWCYRAQATNAGGSSDWSNSQCVFVAPTAAPELAAIDNPDSKGSYQLAWTAVPGASSYQLEMRLNNNGWQIAYEGEATTILHHAPMAGEWCYRVRGLNEGGAGPWSNSQCTTVVVHTAFLPIMRKDH